MTYQPNHVMNGVLGTLSDKMYMYDMDTSIVVNIRFRPLESDGSRYIAHQLTRVIMLSGKQNEKKYEDGSRCM